ncbi:MAG: methyl-accepting chemotaxis protein [Desulfurivibrionaceae bacterium]
MLRNMKIGRRLLLGFGVVVLFLVAVGVVAILKIGTIQQLHQTFYQHPFTVVHALDSAHVHIMEMQRDMQAMLFVEGRQEREAAIASLDKSEKAAYGNLKLVRERFLGDKQLVVEIVQDLDVWKEKRAATIALLRANRAAEAAGLDREQTRGIVANIEGKMREIEKFALNKAAELSRDSGRIEEQAVRFTYSLLAAAAMLAVLLALLITRGVTKPLNRAVEVADRLALGDVAVEVGTSSNDETGRLLRSMEKMLQQFKETTQAASRIAVGDLSVAMVPRSEQDVMGKALASMLQQFRSTAEVATRLAAGDLSVDVVPQSEQDAMGNALASMVQQFRSTAELATRLAAGDLSVSVVPRSGEDVMGNALKNMVEGLREITRELIEGMNVLSSAASEIMASTAQVASGTTETAAAVSQTTSTVEEVKQTAQVASAKARSVSEAAQKAVQVAGEGRKAVEESITGMSRIQEQVEAIAESIVKLSEQSQTIGEIITTVNDLAEQSNLLAVNAAIEAAKAGEQGKGFAVVAQEVKSLADQSKEATAQVRMILGDIQKATNAAVLATEQGSKAVESGVKQSREAGEAIRQMGESIEESAEAALQIAASNQQQLTGMDQVALAMENIKQASEQNVAGSRQVEATVQNLHELGQKLKQLVEQYKV